MKFHFTYITASSSGKHYVGRHSTSKICDGYKGSGKWVRSCLKNNTELHTKILSFYDNVEDLKLAEELLIARYINKSGSMNFNNSSSGFSTGDLNPSCDPIRRKQMSDENWMKTEEGRSFARTNNPSKLPEVKAKRKIKCEEQLLEGTHNFQNPEFIAKKNLIASERWKKDNPMHNPDVVEKVKQRVAESVRNGTHNSTILLACPHCNIKVSAPNAKRWHYDNCKYKVV
jgi:hypothetical protein